MMPISSLIIIAFCDDQQLIEFTVLCVAEMNIVVVAIEPFANGRQKHAPGCAQPVAKQSLIYTFPGLT